MQVTAGLCGQISRRTATTTLSQDALATSDKCRSHQLLKAVLAGAGYSGDVWPEQPAPPDHPWRKMPRHAMTPHYSGDTIDAQVSFTMEV